MSLPTEDAQVKAAGESAQTFIDTYYEALNRLSPISQFYTTSSKSYMQSSPPRAPDISINGTVLAQPGDYEALLKKQGRDTRYEIESFDAQVVNPRFALAAPADLQTHDLNRISILVQVTGRVTVGGAQGKDGAAAGAAASRSAPAGAGGSGAASTATSSGPRAFNEVFVLVPNWDALGKNSPKGLKRMVILSQNFRAL